MGLINVAFHLQQLNPFNQRLAQISPHMLSWGANGGYFDCYGAFRLRCCVLVLVLHPLGYCPIWYRWIMVSELVGSK